MKRAGPFLTRHELHLLPFCFVLALLNWPLLSVLDSAHLRVGFLHILLHRGMAITLLFIVAKGCRRVDSRDA